MKSNKKLKAGQVHLPTLPTLEQKAAMTAADSPGTENPFLTKSAVGEILERTIDVTDYNYDITGLREDWTPTMYLSKNYIPNSVKIYINGMRLTRGNSYDFREVGFNIIVFNFLLEPTDVLVVDYKTIHVPEEQV